MSKSLHGGILVILTLIFPLASLAQTSGNTTLQTGGGFNLDSGNSTTSGADILWTGANLTAQGKATAYLVPNGASSYANLTQALLADFGALYSASPIPSSQLTATAVVAVKTNGGNYAKLQVTSNSGGTLLIQYTTFGASSGPTITKVQNNYSYILPGLPNYGIAPGSLFIIVGTGLTPAGTQAVLQSSSQAGGLPLTLNGTSITVVINGTTVYPALYYTTPTQLAAVLPSNTPVGTGTITVTYNNQTSPTAQMVVVASALGLDSLYGTGNGLAVATDNSTGALFGYGNSVSPGEVVVLWGSGTGADTANDDRTFPLKQDNLNLISALYVGGVPAQILYQGRSQYPGVDQIDIIIPQGVTPGCFVGIVAVSGTGSTAVVSNTVTLPLNQGGGSCSDANLGITGSQLLSLGGQTTVRTGTLSIGQFTGPSGNGSSFSTISSATASFEAKQGTSYGSGSGLVSVGSCIVIPPMPSGSISPSQPTGLDAGSSINLSGPAGSVQMVSMPSTLGSYNPANFLSPAFIPASGGQFIFNNGSGGKDVQGFNVAVNYPNPALSWTELTTLNSINRSQGVTVHWTGGASNTYVLITGSSASGPLSVSFSCYAPQSALQFTVPNEVLLALPAGNGSLSLYNSTTPVTFTANGTLDSGTATVDVAFFANETYN